MTPKFTFAAKDYASKDRQARRKSFGESVASGAPGGVSFQDGGDDGE